MDQDEVHRIERGHRPRYAIVTAVRARKLVADLDRAMTVEKSILATWTRTPGFSTDIEARQFAQALARKRARFAFPDDFNDLVKKLQSRIDDKHDRLSDEGRALRALREIRVTGSPSWDDLSVEVFFSSTSFLEKYASHRSWVNGLMCLMFPADLLTDEEPRMNCWSFLS